MPSTPFDTAHQDSLRLLIGKVLPGAGAHLIAEAVAAGYGFATHEALGGKRSAPSRPDGPRHGPPPEKEAPDGPLAQQRLRTGRLYMQVGFWEHAGSILGTAMGVAPAGLKGEVAAALEQAIKRHQEPSRWRH